MIILNKKNKEHKCTQFYKSYTTNGDLLYAECVECGREVA